MQQFLLKLAISQPNHSSPSVFLKRVDVATPSTSSATAHAFVLAFLVRGMLQVSIYGINNFCIL